MRRVRSSYRPFIILAGVAVADFIARVSFGFQMNRVAAFEAVLFGAASLLLLWAANHDKDSAALKRIDLWLAGLLALGAIRAGLWAGGLAVAVANLVVLVIAVLSVVGFVLRRWVRRRHRGAADNA